jgi:hypothetical protein
VIGELTAMQAATVAALSRVAESRNQRLMEAVAGT